MIFLLGQHFKQLLPIYNMRNMTAGNLCCIYNLWKNYMNQTFVKIYLDFIEKIFLS